MPACTHLVALGLLASVGFAFAQPLQYPASPRKNVSDTFFGTQVSEEYRWLEDGMKRPKRLKMAKPAALAMAEASLIPLD